MKIARKPLEERFWEKVDKRGSDDCWLWTGCCDAGGYGIIGAGGRGGKSLKVHRLSYELHNGSIPIGEGYHGTCVCHACDNRRCVNPAHLWLGTMADDTRDKMEKGRWQGGGGTSFGEKNGRVKLTEVQVTAIRQDYKWHSRTHGSSALARKYRVSCCTICRIVKNKTWK